MEIHKIRKTGGSFTVVVPKKYLSVLGVVANDYVAFFLYEGKIWLEPLKKVRVPKRCKKRR